MKTTILILASLTLSACAPTMFTKAGSTEADFNRERYQCQQDAAQYTANLGITGNPMTIARETQNCLQYKYGWVIK